VAVYTILAILAVSMLLPFLHELAKSLSYPTAVEAGKVGLWPRELTL